MLPILLYRDLCKRHDALQFSQKYPHPVLVHLALGSTLLTAASPGETMYRAQGMGIKRRSPRAKGSAYMVYRLRKKPKAPGARVSVGFLRTNDVAIQEATISRLHAYFEARPGGFVVVDPGSSNGILVNDKRVAPGQPAPLRSGDRVGLGKVNTLFMMPTELHQFVRRIIGG